MTGKMWKALAVAALAAGVPAAAQGNGNLTTKIELEKSVPGAEGQAATKTYVAPQVVVPGGRIRVTLVFTNIGADPAAGITLVNPIPQGLAFDGTANPEYFGVSIDGGKTFGALDALTVAAAGAAPRSATATHVTHVRWQWPDAIASEQSRSVAFFGRVR